MYACMNDKGAHIPLLREILKGLPSPRNIRNFFCFSSDVARRHDCHVAIVSTPHIDARVSRLTPYWDHLHRCSERGPARQWNISTEGYNFVPAESGKRAHWLNPDSERMQVESTGRALKESISRVADNFRQTLHLLLLCSIETITYGTE